MKKYQEVKKSFNGQNQQVTLSTVNAYLQKKIGYTITAMDMVLYCERMATGKIVDITKDLLFDKYSRNNSPKKTKRVITRACKLIILACRGVDIKLAQNAYITYSYLDIYNTFLKQCQEQHLLTHVKPIHFDNYQEDGNMIAYLKQQYNKFVTQMTNKQEHITYDQIKYYTLYESLFTGMKLLQDINMMRTSLKIEIIYKNKTYEIIKNYISQCNQEFHQSNYESLNTLKCYRSVIQLYDSNLKEYYDATVNYGHNRYVLEQVQAYLKNPISFAQFCTDIKMKENEIFNCLNALHQKEISMNLSQVIDKERNKNNQIKQVAYEEFVDFMKEKFDTKISAKDFTLAHYYSLTNIPLSEMIDMLREHREVEIASYMNQVFFYNQQKLKKCKPKSYPSISSEDFKNVRTQMNQEGFPALTGIFEEAYHFYRRGLLDNFTKKHYIRDLIKEKELVKKNGLS